MNDFIKLVKQMRTAQSGYFKAPNGTQEKKDLLQLSFKLERQVDEFIKALPVEMPEMCSRCGKKKNDAGYCANNMCEHYQRK